MKGVEQLDLNTPGAINLLHGGMGRGGGGGGGGWRGATVHEESSQTQSAFQPLTGTFAGLVV